MNKKNIKLNKNKINQNNLTKNNFNLNFININLEKNEIKEKKYKEKEKDELFINKITSNRNFRLFHKDVVIKKIMRNFMKFLKSIITHFFKDINKSVTFDFNILQYEGNFTNFNKSRLFLNNNYLRDLISFSQRKLLDKKIQELKLIDFYKDFFLNSKYLLDFIYPKIIKDHEILYHSHFVEYLNKICD